MRNFFLLILMLFLLLSCDRNNEPVIQDDTKQNANFVTLAQAKTILGGKTFKRAFNKNKSGKIIDKIIDNVETVSLGGSAVYYIINYKGGGYIILSADKRVDPVLAMSETDTFDYSKAKKENGIGFWLGKQAEGVTYIRNNNVEATPNIQNFWDILIGNAPRDNYDPIGTTVLTGALISTNWGQLTGYNDYTPTLSCGYHTPTGCVATAIAQIMKYYNFSSVNNYNWSTMPANSGSLETARLMKDIGTAVQMVYGCYGSGAYNSSIVPGFSSFGYRNVLTKNIAGQYQDSTLDNQLNLSQPVLMTGNNGSVGHAWVCDQKYYYSYWDPSQGYGYSTVLYHMNWGWDSDYNNYYNLSNLTPAGQNFNNNLTMFYNFTH